MKITKRQLRRIIKERMYGQGGAAIPSSAVETLRQDILDLISNAERNNPGLIEGSSEFLQAMVDDLNAGWLPPMPGD